MLKGSQRKMIMLRPRGSDLFETAYFVLKEDAESHLPNQNEMLKEASKILEENSFGKGKRAELSSLLLTLVIGFFLGAFSVGAIWLCSLL